MKNNRYQPFDEIFADAKKKKRRVKKKKQATYWEAMELCKQVQYDNEMF
jgi:hypothetical protein